MFRLTISTNVYTQSNEFKKNRCWWFKRAKSTSSQSHCSIIVPKSLWKKASVASLPAICRTSHLGWAQNSWLSPTPRKEAGTDYLEDIQRCCLCLQGGLRKAKAQLKSKLANADKDKKKGYYKDIGSERKTEKTVEQLLSDAGDIVGGACKAHLGKKVWIITNVTIGICVCVNQKCKIIWEDIWPKLVMLKSKMIIS